MQNVQSSSAMIHKLHSHLHVPPDFNWTSNPLQKLSDVIPSNPRFPQTLPSLAHRFQPHAPPSHNTHPNRATPMLPASHGEFRSSTARTTFYAHDITTSPKGWVTPHGRRASLLTHKLAWNRLNWVSTKWRSEIRSLSKLRSRFFLFCWCWSWLVCNDSLPAHRFKMRDGRCGCCACPPVRNKATPMVWFEDRCLPRSTLGFRLREMVGWSSFGIVMSPLNC
jgi:hypothetical protein